MQVRLGHGAPCEGERLEEASSRLGNHLHRGRFGAGAARRGPPRLERDEIFERKRRAGLERHALEPAVALFGGEHWRELVRLGAKISRLFVGACRDEDDEGRGLELRELVRDGAIPGPFRRQRGDDGGATRERGAGDLRRACHRAAVEAEQRQPRGDFAPERSAATRARTQHHRMRVEGATCNVREHGIGGRRLDELNDDESALAAAHALIERGKPAGRGSERR